jgi:hypothetical protein
MKTEISIGPWGGKLHKQLLAFVAIALTPSMLLTQAGNQLKGQDKAPGKRRRRCEGEEI